MRIAVALAAAWCSRPGLAAGGGRAFESYAIAEVADGIFTFVAPDSYTGLVSGNSTVVVGDDSLLVYDTGNFPSLTRKMVADIRKRTSLPVRFVVNSHWHFDHALGNTIYKEAYPGAAFVSTAFTRGRMEKNFDKFARGTGDAIAEDLPRVKAVLESGKKRDGKTPLTDSDRKFFEIQLRDEEGALPEYRAAKLVLADLTFKESLTVHLGKREVRLMHLGRGNTGGDAVAFIPDAKVLLSGDILVLPTPYGYGSYPAEWAAVLKKIEAMNPAVIVPGHGPIQRDLAAVQRLGELIESARTQMGPLVARGLGLDEARKAVDLSSYRQALAGDDADRGRAFDHFFAGPFLDRVYQEAKGSLAPE